MAGWHHRHPHQEPKSEIFTLDATGNWSEYVHKSTGTTDLDHTRSHDKANELTGFPATPTGTAWATPAYDEAGNMTTLPQPADPGQSFTAVYDAWNRLVELDDGSNTIARYSYDGSSWRIEKETYSGGTLSETRHFYHSSAWRVLEERVGSDPTSASAERQYVWGDRYLDELVERDRDTNGDGSLNERLYALQDANFDVTAIADASGNIVERYSYTPYGTRTIMDGSWGGRSSSSYDWTIGHQGLAHDDLTGLISDRCRFLHPGLGRFIGRDPLSYVDGMNLYEYVGGNPNGWVVSATPTASFAGCWGR